MPTLNSCTGTLGPHRRVDTCRSAVSGFASFKLSAPSIVWPWHSRGSHGSCRHLRCLDKHDRFRPGLQRLYRRGILLSGRRLRDQPGPLLLSLEKDPGCRQRCEKKLVHRLFGILMIAWVSVEGLQLCLPEVRAEMGENSGFYRRSEFPARILPAITPSILR